MAMTFFELFDDDDDARRARDRLTALLNAAAWQFAVTMPDNPHCYTLRRRWRTDEDF